MATDDALASMMSKTSEVIANEADELAVVANRISKYWDYSLDGKSNQARDRLKAQLRLLIETHHIELRRNLAATVEKVLSALSAVGVEMLENEMRKD